MQWIPFVKGCLTSLPQLSTSLLIIWTLLLFCIPDTDSFMSDSIDLKYWKCILKKGNVCPDKDIRMYLYSSEYHGTKIRIDILKHNSLKYAGWDPHKRNVIIIHGFNQSEDLSPMSIIRDAYIRRRDYNVFMLDFADLAPFPCYLSSLSNTRLVAQCAAQFYSHLTHHGASAYDIHCVGHSLGAHICGMMSNHLSHRMHKIIGIDPARPLVDRYGDKAFRLTRDDANFVQVIHTNAWFLGEAPQVGHVDFCVNGGRMQPSCAKEGRMIRRARCSHYMGACFFAATVSENGRRHKGHPCSLSCSGHLGPGTVSMGEHTPLGTQGTYCLRMKDNLGCPFD